MFYVALVRDVNPIANTRVLSAYVSPVPTVFFDGGYESAMGGGTNMVPYYTPLINSTAQRQVPSLDLQTAIDWLGDSKVRVHVAVGNGVSANTGPSVPSPLVGGGRVKPGHTMAFTTQSVDPEANAVYYQWDWGEGQVSDWQGPFNSSAATDASHTWAVTGDYLVKVKARDPFGVESAWSSASSVTVNCCLGRVGDANESGDDEPTIGDVSVMIDAKFISGTCAGVLNCLGEGDINLSGGTDPTCDDITIGDISVLIDYLFITGSSLGLPDCL